MTRRGVLKLVDVFLQMIALIIPYAFTHVDSSLLIGWVALGVAQQLSCAINFFVWRSEYRAKSRKWYEKFSLIYSGNMLLFLITNQLRMSQVADLFLFIPACCIWISPALALWYFMMCGSEFRRAEGLEPL